MCDKLIKETMLLLVILVMFSTINAQLLMNYQGRLTDDTGDPVADDTYVITFSLWSDSTGGSQQWTETHPNVQTSSGLFSVVLGSDSTLHESVFETEPIFLEIGLEGLGEIIEPRTRLTSVPSAAYAKKVIGDVETGEGYLNLKSPDSSLAVSISSIGRGSPAFVRMYNPSGQYPGQTLVQLSSESDGGKFSLYPPGNYASNPAFTIGLEPMPFSPPYLSFLDPTGDVPHDPYVKMGLDPSPFGGYLEFYDPGSGWADSPMVKMGVEPVPFHRGYVAMYNPEIDPPPKLMEMSINDSTELWSSRFAIYNGLFLPPVPAKLFEIVGTPSSGASMSFFDDIGQVMGVEPMPFNEGFSMYLMDPGDDGKLLEIIGNHNTDEANIYFMEPGDDKVLMSMNSAPSSGASIKMFNPQPEPPAQLLEMKIEEVVGPASEWGSTFSMYLTEPLDKNILEMSAFPSTGASIKMFNPQPEPPREVIEMNVTESGGNWEGYFNMYSTEPLDNEAKNFEISNTVAYGANLKLFNAQPGKASTTAIDMYYDSINGGGTVRCESDADNSLTYRTGRDLLLGTDYGPGIYMHYSGSAYFAGYIGIGVPATTNILEVQQSSATDPIADAWTVYSSQRWKKNVSTIKNALDKVSRLRGVSFDWIKNNKHDIGLVAEEVGEIIPEIVTFEDNGVDARSIDYSRLTAILIEAVKELKAENEQLKKRLSDIESQL